MEEIKQMRKSGISLDDLISLCQNNLITQDDDWIKTGMELGLIGDAAIFGVEEWRRDEAHQEFTDHLGSIHKIELTGLPGENLGYQGVLSDVSKFQSHSELWRILDWNLIPQKGFTFGKKDEKILLDFDLDCFMVDWKDYTFPWPDEVFINEFHKSSNYWSTKGWTGKRFFDELLKRANLITIAKEPECCGGKKKADKILKKVNHFLFDNMLSI